MYYKVEGGQITSRSLPTTGMINGASVMNYHKLPQETLMAEGWLPVEEVEPEYNPATHRLIIGSEKVLKDSVEVSYVAEEILIAEPTEKEIELSEVEARLKSLEAEEIKRNPDYKVPVKSV